MSCQSRNPETIGVEITNGDVGSAATTRVTFCRCRVSLHRVEILPGSSCADSWAGPYICDSGPRKTGIEPTFAGGLSPAAASDVPTRLRPSGVRIDAYVGLGWASVIHCRLCFVALHLVSGAPPSTSRAPPPLAKAYSTSSQEAAICRTSLCSLPLKAVECRALVGATLAGIFRFISRG